MYAMTSVCRRYVPRDKRDKGIHAFHDRKSFITPRKKMRTIKCIIEQITRKYSQIVFILLGLSELIVSELELAFHND